MSFKDRKNKALGIKSKEKEPDQDKPLELLGIDLTSKEIKESKPLRVDSGEIKITKKPEPSSIKFKPSTPPVVRTKALTEAQFKKIIKEVKDDIISGISLPIIQTEHYGESPIKTLDYLANKTELANIILSEIEELNRKTHSELMELSNDPNRQNKHYHINTILRKKYPLF